MTCPLCEGTRTVPDGNGGTEPCRFCSRPSHPARARRAAEARERAILAGTLAAPKTQSDRARLGGMRAREKYGREFYQRIGQMGGARTASAHDKTYYQRIGKLGHEARSAARPPTGSAPPHATET